MSAVRIVPLLSKTSTFSVKDSAKTLSYVNLWDFSPKTLQRYEIISYKQHSYRGILHQEYMVIQKSHTVETMWNEK